MMSNITVFPVHYVII